MAELTEDDFLAALEEQQALAEGVGPEEVPEQPVPQQAQAPVQQEEEAPSFVQWDEYRNHPGFDSLSPAQKQNLFDDWQNYATQYLAQNGELATEEDIKYTEGVFTDIAKIDNLRKPIFNAPNYVEQLAQQAQSGFGAMEAGTAGYASALGMTDTATASDVISQKYREQRDRYVNPELKKFTEDQLGFFGSAGRILTNPFDIALPLFTQSMASSAPAIALGAGAGAAGTLVGGPVGGLGAGLAVGSAASGVVDGVITFNQMVIEEVGKRGLDPANAQDVQSVLDDPKFVSDAVAYSAARGVVISAAELATFGAGKYIAGAAKLSKASGLKKVGVGAAITGVETIGEGVGETGAQIAAPLATGKPVELQPGEIAAEMFVQAPGSIAIAGLQTARALVDANAPSSASEVTREAVQAAAEGKFEKVLGVQPSVATPTDAQKYYDGLSIADKARVLGMAPNVVLTQEQGTYSSLSEEEKTRVQVDFETETKAQQGPTVEEAEARAREAFQPTEPAPVVAQEPVPVAETPAPAEEVPVTAVVQAPSPTPLEIVEAKPIAEQESAPLQQVAPASAQAVAEEEIQAPAPVVETPAPVPVAEAPAPTPAPSKLPRNLAGAKPRYKQFTLNFANDIDRALYIVAQATKSARDADYLDFAMKATGLDESQARAAGRAIRASIKEQANTSDAETLDVPQSDVSKPKVEAPMAETAAPVEQEKGFEFNLTGGGRTFGVISKDGKTARLVGAYAARQEGPVTTVRGSKTVEQTINLLKNQGVNNLQVRLQSEQMRKVLASLVQKKILENPRDLAGVSVDQYPTTFSIPATPVTQKLPPTKKQVTALSKLGYLPADIEGLDRTQAKDIVTKQTPKTPTVEAPKETAPEVATGAPAPEAPAVPPAPVSEPTAPKAEERPAGEVGAPVAPPAGQPTAPQTEQERLTEAEQKLQAKVGEVIAEADQLGVDEESVRAWLGPTPSEEKVLRTRAVLRLLNLGLADVYNNIRKVAAKTRGRQGEITQEGGPKIKRVVFTTREEGAGLLSDPKDMNALDVIQVNPDRLLSRLRADVTTDAADFFVKVLEEELLHLQHGWAAFDLFASTVPKDQVTPENFKNFFIRQSEEIENSLTLGQIQEVVGKYAGIDTTGKTKEQLIQEFAQIAGRRGRLAEEYLRTLIQRRMLGDITEDKVRSLTPNSVLRSLGMIKNWLGKFVGETIPKKYANQTPVERYYTAVSDLIYGNSFAKIREARDEQGTAIPGKETLSASTDPMAVRRRFEQTTYQKELVKKINEDFGLGKPRDARKGAIWAKTVGRLIGKFPTFKPNEVEAIVGEDIPDAVKFFDPSQGAVFTTYLYQRAYNSMLDARDKQRRTGIYEAGRVDVPGSVERARFQPLSEQIKKVEKPKDVTAEATAEEIASELEGQESAAEEAANNIVARDADEVVQKYAEVAGKQAEEDQSFEEMMGPKTISGELTAPGFSPSQAAARNDLSKVFDQLFSTFSEQEQDVFDFLFRAKEMENPPTRQGIMAKYNLGHSRQYDRIVESVREKVANTLAENNIFSTGQLSASVDPLGSPVIGKPDSNSLVRLSKLYDEFFNSRDLKDIMQNIADETTPVEKPYKDLAKYIVDNPRWDWIFKSGETSISPANTIAEYQKLYPGSTKFTVKENKRLESETLAFYLAKPDRIFLNKNLLIADYLRNYGYSADDTESKRNFNNELASTFLHEFIHKGTLRIAQIHEAVQNAILVDGGYSYRARDKRYFSRATPNRGDSLLDVLNKPSVQAKLTKGKNKIDELNNLLSDYGPLQTFLVLDKVEDIKSLYAQVLSRATVKAKQDFSYELSDFEEFMAQAFNNPRFQSFLASIQVEGGPTAFEKLKKFIKELFELISKGAPAIYTAKEFAEESMLAKVLQEVSNLIELQPGQARILKETKLAQSVVSQLSASVDPMATQALKRSLLSVPEDISSLLKVRTYFPYENKELLQKANDFVDANAGENDIFQAKIALDRASETQVSNPQRIITLAVIGKRLQDAVYGLDQQIKKGGNTPELSALRDKYSNDLYDILSVAQDILSASGQDLQAGRVFANLFTPEQMVNVYTKPIKDAQKKLLAANAEIIRLRALIQELKNELAAKAVRKGIGVIATPGPEDKFYEFLALFGDLEPNEQESFQEYLTRIGIDYPALMAELETKITASVDPTTKASPLPKDLRNLNAREAIRQLVGLDKNFFSKLVNLRIKTGAVATTAEVATAQINKGRSQVSRKSRPIELQTVFDFFNTTESEKPTSEEPIEKDSLPLMVRLAKYASDSVTDRVLKSLGMDKKTTPKGLFDSMERQVRKYVNAQFREEMDPKKTAIEDTRTPEQKLTDLVERIGLAEQIFNQTKANLQARLDEDTRLRAAKVEGQMSDADRTALQAAVNRTFDVGKIVATAKEVRQLVDFKAEARKHISQRGATVGSLSRLIKEKLPNLNDAQTKVLADLITANYNRLVKDSGASQLNNILKRSLTKASKQPKKEIDQMLELMNIGAFDEEKFYNAISERFDLPAWDEAVVAEIKKRGEAVQRLPQGSDQRTVAALQLKGFIAQNLAEQAKGYAKAGYVLDVMSSVWKAGVLSGFGTQSVNLLSTGGNVGLELLTSAIGYAAALNVDNKIRANPGRFIYDVLMTYWDNLGRVAPQEAMDAFATGFGRLRSENQKQLTTLDSFSIDSNLPKGAKATAKWSLNNYLALWKLVGRAMAAADTFNASIAHEAKLRMQMRYLLMSEKNMSPKQTNELMNNLFSADSDMMKGIREQVAREAGADQFGTLDGLEPKSLAYRVQNRKIEAGKRRRIAQLREQAIATEVGGEDADETIKGIKKFTEVATFNNDPTGGLGWIGDAIARIGNRFKLAAPFTSFTRTVANVVNSSLNYTPYGFARMAGFSFGNLAGNMGSKYEFKSPEGVEFYKLQAQATMGTIALLALASLFFKDMKDPWDKADFAVTGLGPSNKNKRDQLRASGWAENSVKITTPLGPLQFRHSDIPGLSLVLGGLGMLSDSIRYGSMSDEDATTLAAYTAASLGSVVFEKNILSGAKSLFDILKLKEDPVAALQKGAGQYVGGITNPGLFKWLSQTVGVNERGMVEQIDYRKLNSTVPGFLLGLTPVAIKVGSPRLNRLGEPVEEYPWAASTKRIGFFPEVKPHPVLSPLVGADLFVPGISRLTKINVYRKGRPEQVRVDVTEDTYYDYAKYNGQYLKRVLTPIRARSLANRARVDREGAQDELQDLAQQAKKYAVDRIEAQIRTKGLGQ